VSVNVKLPQALVENARRYGAIEHRSVPKQIEYWSQIGKIAAENQKPCTSAAPTFPTH